MQKHHYIPDHFREVKNKGANLLLMTIGFLLLMVVVSAIARLPDGGLNLSLPHVLLLGCSGLLAVWASLNSGSKVYWASLGLAMIYGFHVLLAFLMGYPVMVENAVPNSDGRSIMFVPGLMDLGQTDYFLHALLSILFFVVAMYWDMTNEDQVSKLKG